MATPLTRAAALVLAGLTLTAAPSFAQRRRGDQGGTRQGSERAVPRSQARRPDAIAPRDNGSRVGPRVAPRDNRRDNGSRVARRDDRRNGTPYRRPYYNGSRSYGYRPYAYRPSPYGYRLYGYRPGVSLYFGLPYSSYGYSGYGYGPSAGYGYYTAVPGRGYGALRIVDAPEDAQVFVDGYYAGIVDDYDGVFQRLNLEPGQHRIEIEAPGYQRIEFDVRVEPGQTVTYHARF